MRPDPHSFADTEQPQTRSIDLALRADFLRRVLEGEIALRFREPGARTPRPRHPRPAHRRRRHSRPARRFPGSSATPSRSSASRLRIALPPAVDGVRVRYATSPQATALQWLEPSQTAGDAAVPLLAVAADPRAFAGAAAGHAADPHLGGLGAGSRSRPAADADGRRARSERGEATEAVDSFHMPQPIPRYLLAFAVGDLVAATALAALGGLGRTLARRRGRRGVRRSRADDGRRREAVRPVRMGSLRHPGDAAELSIRRHGEPAPDVRHPLGPRRGPLAGERDRARARARLDRQPGHQRQRRRLLAQRRIHRLRRAAHPRGPGRARLGGDARGGGAARSEGRAGPLRLASRADAAAQPPRRASIPTRRTRPCLTRKDTCSCASWRRPPAAPRGTTSSARTLAPSASRASSPSSSSTSSRRVFPASPRAPARSSSSTLRACRPARREPRSRAARAAPRRRRAEPENPTELLVYLQVSRARRREAAGARRALGAVVAAQPGAAPHLRPRAAARRRGGSGGGGAADPPGDRPDAVPAAALHGARCASIGRGGTHLPGGAARVSSTSRAPWWRGC